VAGAARMRASPWRRSVGGAAAAPLDVPDATSQAIVLCLHGGHHLLVLGHCTAAASLGALTDRPHMKLCTCVAAPPPPPRCLACPLTCLTLPPQITDDQIGMRGGPEWVTAAATVNFIRTENMCYAGCPLQFNGRSCNKKLVGEEGSWYCERCAQSVPQPAWRYIVSMQVRRSLAGPLGCCCAVAS
jgi:hypothetical protein